MKIVAFGAFVLVAVLAAFELLCQFVIGLGDPPLFLADTTMEFVLQPSKTYYRFHNRISVNQYAMRADVFPPKKSSPNELRVLVIGDSIVYGGVRIDQTDIATEILKRTLRQQLNRPVIVGNGSAKGWGPPAELGYLKRYGTLNADLVMFVFSSHDYEDVPTFTHTVGVASEYPNKKPLLALEDLVGTYVLPRFQRTEVATASSSGSARSEENIDKCRNAERDLYALARSSHARVVLVQHLSLPELTGEYQRGYYVNQATAKGEHVPYVDDGNELRADLKSGHNPFYEGDLLHLNRLGQVGLAHVLRRAIDLGLNREVN